MALSEQIVEVFSGLLPLLPLRGRHPGLYFSPDRRDACQRRRLCLIFQSALAVSLVCRLAVLPGNLTEFDQSGHRDPP